MTTQELSEIYSVSIRTMQNYRQLFAKCIPNFAPKVNGEAVFNDVEALCIECLMRLKRDCSVEDAVDLIAKIYNNSALKIQANQQGGTMHISLDIPNKLLD